MEQYLVKNKAYWDKGYEAENVESFVFRPYGRIFKWQFGLSGARGERLLDFGCGAGAALGFFKGKGFDVYGVDISRTDIERCRRRMPDVADHFAVIDPKPSRRDRFFGGKFDLVIAIQALYYYSDADMEERLLSLRDQMLPGALIYATMMGPRNYYYKHSVARGGGLREVRFSKPRLKVSNYFVNFTRSPKDLLRKFRMFKKVHVGYYDALYREDEGSDFHYTFVGRK